MVLLLAGSSVQAQPFDPIVELFRLGQDERLVIDRGGPVALAGDVNADGVSDILVGAGVGGIRVVFGPTNGFNGTLNAQQLNGSSGFVILNDADNDSVLAGAGDINDDGIDDIVVGSLTGTRVIFGSAGAFPRSVDVAALDGSNGFVFNTPASEVQGAGDVNGDGIADLLVGNGNASPNGQSGAGVSYVLFGRRTGFPAVVQPASLDGMSGFAILGALYEDRSGSVVAPAGDFNADGVDDILIGAPNKTQGSQAEVGEAYLVFGSRTAFPPAISLADIDGGNGFVFRGSNIQDSTGASVGAIGDLNHDGIDDVAIGAPGKGPFGSPSDYPGEVHVVFGSTSVPAALTEADLDGTRGFVARGIRGGVIPIEPDQPIWGDLAGTDLSAAGDINGDGIDDMIIGASHTIITPQRKGVGQAYVIHGSMSAFPARLGLSDLDGANGFRINGTGTTDYFGVSVSSGGDFNADGLDDLLIGASGQGESYVIYSRETGLDSQPPASAPASTGSSSGFPGTVFNPGTDAAPLAFNELRDPTGPEPLPPGTSVTLGDAATPGNIAPNPAADAPAPLQSATSPVAPPATLDAQSTSTPAAEPGSSAATASTDETTATGASGTGDPAAPANDAAEGADDINVTVGRKGGGSVFYLPVLLLLMGIGRLHTVHLRRFRN